MNSSILQCLLVIVEVLFSASWLNAQSASNADQYGPREIETAYQYQVAFGQRMYHPMKGQECFLSKTQLVTRYQGQDLVVPCRFVLESRRHLKEILEQGAAQYLFPLDADHAQLAVPVEIWNEKIRNLPGEQILPALLQEPALVAIYRTAQRPTLADPAPDRIIAETKKPEAVRNVLGFFDGRPVIILPPKPSDPDDPELQKYHIAGEFYFLAHRLGEMVFSVRGKQVTFDMSFDSELAANLP
jgi:hypothetical protein